MQRRRLPHLAPQGKWIFVTWALHGAMRPSAYPPPHKQSAGQAFVWMDRYLDTATTGPMYLHQEPIARMVIDCLKYGERTGRYDLPAYVLMGNHVHALILPRRPLAEIMKSLKGYSARQANRILERTGDPLWQAESYDHWVRTPEEFNKIVAYIENNPVKAGLVKDSDDYRWSSASAGTTAGTAGHEACATPH